MSLEAADFEIDNFMIDQLVYPENDSGVVTFFLTPKKAQKRAWVVIHVFKNEQRSQQLGSLGLNTEVKGEGELITDTSWQLQTSAKITEVSTGIKGVSPLESVSFDGNVDFSVSVEDLPLPPPTKNPQLTGLQIQELRDIILQAFPNEGDLEQELLFKLDISYQNLSDGSNYRQRVTNLITQYFESGNEHTTADLLDVLIIARPRNRALVNFKNAYYQ
jgi:hypothetical protein